jgi:hypothetical protein
MLEQLDATLEALAKPVHGALYAADEAAARGALAQAEAAWAAQTAAAGAGEAEAAACYLRLLRFQVDEYFAGRGQEPEGKRALSREVIRQALAELEPPAATPQGAVMRARTLFHIKCIADRTGVQELPEAAGEELAAQVPEPDRDNAFWSFLSAWAFDHRLPDRMFEAYSEYLVHRKRSLSHYNWERLRLMYLLTSGQAIFRDVEAVIDRLPNAVKAESFGRHIQPRCEEAGVWDERLQMLFELKLFDLGDRDPRPLPPGLDRHFRRHPWDETDLAPPPAGG